MPRPKNGQLLPIVTVEVGWSESGTDLVKDMEHLLQGGNRAIYVRPGSVWARGFAREVPIWDSQEGYKAILSTRSLWPQTTYHRLNQKCLRPRRPWRSHYNRSDRAWYPERRRCHATSSARKTLLGVSVQRRDGCRSLYLAA